MSNSQELASSEDRFDKARSVEFSDDQVKKLIDEARMPREIGEFCLEEMKIALAFQRDSEELVKKNPNPSQADWLALHSKHYALEGLDGRRQKQIELSEFLFQNRALFEKDSKSGTNNEQVTPFFRSIDNINCFGVNKHLLDRYYHLPELLREASLRFISGNDYEVTSTTKTNACGVIRLSHHFTASSEEEARWVCEDYRKRMAGDATRAFLAFWKLANKKRSFHFSARLTEIMDEIADEKRGFHFSTKEKTNFWLATKMLLRTTFSIECGAPKKRERYSFPHQLLELKGERIDFEHSNYPNEVVVAVLNPEHFMKRASLATAITHSTLKLSPSDIFLALTLQARGAQRQGQPPMQFKEDDLIKIANLAKCATSNKSEARSRLLKKLNKFKCRGIVDRYSKNEGTYYISSSNQKKSN